MPFGSISEVKEEVHRTFEACGSSKGGIVACGEVGPDVPLENIRAMYEAFREYGTYARDDIFTAEARRRRERKQKSKGKRQKAKVKNRAFPNPCHEAWRPD